MVIVLVFTMQADAPESTCFRIPFRFGIYEGLEFCNRFSGFGFLLMTMQDCNVQGLDLGCQGVTVSNANSDDLPLCLLRPHRSSRGVARIAPYVVRLAENSLDWPFGWSKTSRASARSAGLTKKSTDAGRMSQFRNQVKFSIANKIRYFFRTFL
jgi:hypothetical protein